MWKTTKKSVSGAKTSYWVTNHLKNFGIGLSSGGEHYQPMSELNLIQLFLSFFQKLYFNPHVLFSITAAMFLNISKILNNQFVKDTLRNNYANFNYILLYGFREKDVQSCTWEKQQQKYVSEAIGVTNHFENNRIGLSSDDEKCYPMSNFAKFKFLIIYKKLYFDPYFLFLVTVAIFLTFQKC